ncbi:MULTISPECIES: AAA family ATPase [Brevundimonas]|uniref:AAA family ATPase n=1 Tax=Brevundimonas TaxID=41275 RepID=UPI001908EBCE|nr:MULTISPECIES: AAA family ATPase [Brevundimonas]MDA0744701.1 AAA family ATPase [Pseudomonadota bacterium]MBK1968582.1 AAA family ATPase [Brevundimonas diminuta]MBK1975798.1 AAA family ATPase [Brevundimonas diminuta]MDA1321648.1 AAA family ATPase [Pseudomonadota bacterium]MDM8352268.1 AAA family ATPase [Brevundimonas diminuta]
MIGPRRIVLTGGPGSGKTTLLEALAAAGHATSPEAGRAIIRRQQAIDGEALPWKDRTLFAELMLDRELEAHARTEGADGPVFFDRSVPDVVGYLTLCGLPVPAHMERAAQDIRYDRRVFIAPVWPEIFGQDAERKQDLDEARRTFDAMAETYSRFGYELIELPKAPVAERLNFVLKSLTAA